MVTYGHIMSASLEVAMLKLVLRTKREPSVAFDTLVQEVCDSMELDPLLLKRYVAQNLQTFVRTGKNL